jgi:predicted acyltransferase
VNRDPPNKGGPRGSAAHHEAAGSGRSATSPTRVQLLAIYRSLQVLDDEPARYAATVRWFFAGIVVVVAGLVFATIAAV